MNGGERVVRLRNTLPPTIAAVATVALWEAVIRFLDVPKFIVPAPSDVARALVAGLRSGVILDNLGVTLSETLGGFAIAVVTGTLLGVLFAEVPVAEAALSQLVAAFQAVPKLALAPLIVIWFGFGQSSKIVMSALAAFFPIFVNTVIGLKQIDPARLDLMRAIKATRMQTLWLLKVPSALPFIFAGLNVGAIFALLGAIVGEYSGATKGLGFFIVQLNTQLDMPGVFSAIIVLALLGTILDRTIHWLHRRIVFWSPTTDDRGTTKTGLG